jgi:hypothetical protein
MTDMNSIVIVGAGIGLAIVLFLLLRSFVWWYFGISRHLDNQDQIIKHLETIAAERTRNVSKPVITRTDTPDSRSNSPTGR